MENKEIEETLLGKIIVNNEILDKYSELIHKDLFDNPFSKSVYHAIIKLKEQGRDIDIYSLLKNIKGEGVAYCLTEMTDLAFSFNNSLTCIAILTEEFHKRTLRSIVHDVNNKIQDAEEVEEIIEYLTQQLSKLTISTADSLNNTENQIFEFLEDMDKRMNSDGLLGIASGFEKIDNFTGGWQETDLIIIGGASSMGKTSFALALGYNAAKYTNTPTVIFSYEMSAIQLLRRLASMESEINNKYLINGTINEEEYKKIHEAIRKIEDLPISIDEGSITTLTYLMHRIKEYVKNKDIKLVLVDYLQLVTHNSKSGNREQEVGKVTRTLKNLAKELNITIIALSQLNRGVGLRTNSKPTLSDLRESGEIEQAADVVMLIYRPEYYGIEFDDKGNSTKGTANIIFAKGRNIGVGEIILTFKSDITKFINYDKYNKIN
jgi:replicative DNA helicase